MSDSKRPSSQPHSHGHSHPHSHDDDHDGTADTDHGHRHAHVDDAPRPFRANREVPRGAGHGKVLYLDAPSGLAGDMIVAALVDLGVPCAAIEASIAGLPLTGFSLGWSLRARHAIVATHFAVTEHTPQPQRNWAQIRTLLKGARLADGVRTLALRTFEHLAEAEARAHRVAVDDVHFHEVGAVDSIVDVVAAAAALDWLGAELRVSPLPMGRGLTEAAHGTLFLPAPATVECLIGHPTYDGEHAFEFVTPTGAALVGALSTPAAAWPRMTPEATGWGAGTANPSWRPNLLRAVLGEPTVAPESEGGFVLLETNLDDASGELVAYCIERLLAEGAKDAWATPITMKKGRPAIVLSALAQAPDAGRLTVTMLRESTSIGVRTTVVDRVARPREMIEVDTPYGIVPVKVAGGAFGPPQAKPEVDDCARLARQFGVPLREVILAATLAAAAALRARGRT